ncbi:hypothetical protein D9M68_161150 [compost metagenome]|jgi:hypothetical protein|nr:hypothetical protein N183_09105 [Sinorhizobium sp. Sb3]KSV91217.1 hypothetical protein N184_06275 [Sinorhizobium sp. GL28]SDA73565.1 hypothetical protein SAMN03159448_02632 [Sinorhizobium sp. NFACC03]
MSRTETMTHTEEVIERAMAAVAAARKKREREAEWRKRTFGRIDMTPPLPRLKRGGVQLSLRLDGSAR